MKPTFDLNIEGFEPLITPGALKTEVSISDKAANTVYLGRETIKSILKKKDTRMLVITGPCSIHDEKAAIDYAKRLKSIQEKVSDSIFLVMRVYFEKPRTTTGWKGLINDPNLNYSYDISEGLKRARILLHEICEIGVPTATEILDPITPQYIAGLVCWAAIGARTTESQTHREMASGLSMPVGFKNGTDGSLTPAINAMIAARAKQSFLGIDHEGKTCIVKTTGNPFVHMVLRGGTRPNYDSVSIDETISKLAEKNLPEGIIIDCSHDNSRKKYTGQKTAWDNCISQRTAGNNSIVGLMLESNIFESSQKLVDDIESLKYGVSITDECISWETTEGLLLSAHEKLDAAK